MMPGLDTQQGNPFGNGMGSGDPLADFIKLLHGFAFMSSLGGAFGASPSNGAGQFGGGLFGGTAGVGGSTSGSAGANNAGSSSTP